MEKEDAWKAWFYDDPAIGKHRPGSDLRDQTKIARRSGPIASALLGVVDGGDTVLALELGEIGARHADLLVQCAALGIGDGAGRVLRLDPVIDERIEQENYPNARSLLITADDGGSNGSRVRLWKIELQKLADELGLPITVCHLPPGTSKWNKIEHRLFSFITGNWRGKPLVSHQVIVQLIAATTTKTGLKVRCELDQNTYPAGIKASDAEIDAVNLIRHDFHGEWNYTVNPKVLALER